MSEHEGVSVWTRETAARLARWIRLDLSRSITPNTADLMATSAEQGTETVLYRDVLARLRNKLARPLTCPAQHPVFPIELRVTMAPKYRGLSLRLFPNLDGFPTKYLPIRAYFCPVCQELYRQREIDEVFEDTFEAEQREAANAQAR